MTRNWKQEGEAPLAPILSAYLLLGRILVLIAGQTDGVLPCGKDLNFQGPTA